MKKNKIQMRNNFRKKILRRLTSTFQKNKTYKGHNMQKKSYFAIKALNHGTLNSKQIEVCRIYMRRAAAPKKKKKFLEILEFLFGHT